LDNLTDKQQRFVSEYLVDLNATAAAKRAGYSELTASEQGYQLLQKTLVQQAIQQAMHERELRTQATQDKVVDELCAVAFREASDAPLSDLRFCNKLRALELLGKHLGTFREQVELKPWNPPRSLSERKADLEEIARRFGSGQWDEDAELED